MLQQIHDSDEGVDKFIERVKNREDGVKLMGFGHRVYKNYDPRAKIIKNATDDVLEALNVDDPLFDIARRLEEVALSDDFSSRASCIQMWTSTPDSPTKRWVSPSRCSRFCLLLDACLVGSPNGAR